VTVTAGTGSDAVPEAPADNRRWWALGCLCLSLVLIVANNSSLNVNLPILQRALGSSNSGLQWLVDAYSLVFAGLLLPAGALADRYGRKTALQLGLLVVGAASLTAMVCTTTWEVILCRAVMGAGAAFIMPGTLSILTNIFPPEERGKAIAIWAGFAGFGGVLGPMASGFLLDHFYWGSAFFINVPIVALALGAGFFLVPNSKDPADTILDPLGVLLVVSGLLIVLYGVIDGPESGWLTPTILASLVVGGVLLVGFVAWELHNPDPMLDVRLFGNRSFAVGSGTITMQYFALYGLFFIFAQYLELAKGYAPLKTAVSQLPIGILMMIGAPMSARMVTRFGPRAVVGSGLLFTATGLGILASARPSTPLLLLMGAEVLIGLGIGQTTAPSTTLIMTSVRTSKSGVGSAVNDVSRELGGALGIAVLGSVLNSAYRAKIGSRLPRGLPPRVAADAHKSVTDALLDITNPKVHLAPNLIGPLTNAVKVTFADGFGFAMVGGAAMLVLCSVMVWTFQRRGS
jgi:MFS transporter, DHA2 family, integral membrane protein